MTHSAAALTWMLELGGIVFLAGSTISYFLLLSLKSTLKRYALAKPNARSSHKLPTPQGGGIAVIAATAAVTAGAAMCYPTLIGDSSKLAAVFVSVVALAAVGISDDIRPIAELPRLLLQAVAVGLVLTTLPEDLHVFERIPWWIERSLMFGAILWFVNLVNFMDGVDWMTVVEVVPVTMGLAFFGLMGALPPSATLIAIGLSGALIGFAPFNRPVAQLFLGDVGSLPIGLLLGWMLVLLAAHSYVVAAVLLPLYYLADATITLLRRLVGGELIMKAHRRHFYQRAFDGGISVHHIIGRVFAVNVILVALAAATILNNSPTFQLTILMAGAILVGVLLWSFNCVVMKR